MSYDGAGGFHRSGGNIQHFGGFGGLDRRHDRIKPQICGLIGLSVAAPFKISDPSGDHCPLAFVQVAAAPCKLGIPAIPRR
jgi:hypothetical protein